MSIGFGDVFGALRDFPSEFRRTITGRHGRAGQLALGGALGAGALAGGVLAGPAALGTAGLLGRGALGLLGRAAVPSAAVRLGGGAAGRAGLLRGAGRLAGFGRGIPFKSRLLRFGTTAGLGAAAGGALSQLFGSGDGAGTGRTVSPEGLVSIAGEGGLRNALLASQLGGAGGGGGTTPPDFGRTAFLQALDAARSGIRSDFGNALSEIQAREGAGQQLLGPVQAELAGIPTRTTAELAEIENAARAAAQAEGITPAGLGGSLAPFQAAAAAEGAAIPGDISLLRLALGEQGRQRTAAAEGLRGQLLSDIAVRQAEGLADIGGREAEFGLRREELDLRRLGLMAELGLTQPQGRFGPNVISGLRGINITPGRQQRLIQKMPKSAAAIQKVIDDALNTLPQGAAPEDILPLLESQLARSEVARRFPQLASTLLSRYVAFQQ